MKTSLISPYQDTVSNYMYLGLLPFFAGAFGPWIFADYERWLSETFLLYSTVIYAFLAGSIWAVALFGHNEDNKIFIARHIHAAIIFSLTPIFSYFLPDIYNAGMLLLGFLCLLFWEKLFLSEIYPNWYQQLRHRITFLAVACHMLVLWNLMRA
jgi:hypothetical protein